MRLHPNLWRGVIVCLVGLAYGCSDTDSSDPGLDSETHWLMPCEEDSECGPLSCVCSVCSATCDNSNGCSDLPGNAICVMEPEQVQCTSAFTSAGVCLTACTEDSDCAQVREELVCVQGECVDQGTAQPTCTANTECAADQHCLKPTGQCASEGVCAARPEACTLEFAPVCGCDGQTYGNACGAASAGANVAAPGECGGISQGCTSNAACNADSYCLLINCGSEDGSFGICTERPQGCDLDFAPVCGCNGETYGNACGAAGAGVSVASEGECGSTSESCMNNSECDAADYCAQTSCGADNALGACEPRPEVCTQESAPVCGCNAQTYGNDCEAAGAGVNVASVGECP